MAVSQLTIYTSSDASAPTLTGQANSLIAVLRACLVAGYGAKTAAGWSEPIAAAGNCAAFKMGTGGSDCVLFVNDNGPNGTSTYKEAWVTGWETIADIAAPVGSGGGQFPLPAQLLTTGHGVWRKSVSADAVIRPWVIAADKYTCHIWIQTGDANRYYQFSFGDIFALSSSDTKRCLLHCGTAENAVPNWNTGVGDVVQCAGTAALGSNTMPGFYMPRSWGGAGTSRGVAKCTNIGTLTQYSGFAYSQVGIAATPNGPNNAIYIAPLDIWEPNTNPTHRGRLRGLWVAGGSIGFGDGQIFAGAGNYAGKTFQVVFGGGFNASSHWLIETSNTVDTN